MHYSLIIDKCFRPILIINASVLNRVKSTPEDGLNAALFVAFYIIDNLLMPGKVENWLIINDLNNLAIRQIQTKFITNFLKTMQTHIKCRGRRIIVLRVTLGIRMIWNIVSPFVDDRIKKKIIMTKDAHHEEMDKFIHPSQLEEKYGGEAPD